MLYAVPANVGKLKDERNKMKKVYLAGGFKSDWRDKVKSLTGFDFVDPKEKEFGGEWGLAEIGAWDISQIRWSDVVFAYMEKTNPSGFGLACEIGYAYGKEKCVILVLERGHETHKDKYLDFLRNVATITFDTLDDGIKFLETMR